MDNEPCVFCQIVNGEVSASVVEETSDTITFVDLRQWHPGHLLVIPRRHVADIRDADDAIASSVMRAVARAARAVSATFPNDGLSLWHSAGPGAHQEVPHLHVHIHPRLLNDTILRVYPSSPPTPPREVLTGYAEQLRAVMEHP